MKPSEFVIGKIIDNEIILEKIAISKDIEWLKWLDPKELAEFTKQLLKIVNKITKGKNTINDLESFISEWRETSLIYQEFDDDVSAELEIVVNVEAETKRHLFEVVIEPDEDVYQVYCPELPGCHTWGHTKVEALKYIKEAVELYLYDLIADGKPIPVLGMVKEKPIIKLIKTEKATL